ncbi:hypothetical protein GBAR_LOCUS30301, partial [Geodia barretti]
MLETVEAFFQQLLESSIFTADLLEFIEETWREVNQRLTKALFISLNTVMLASLSRLWVCLRYHLLGIAETYSVLKSTVPQAKTPVSHVVSVLKQSQSRYLGTSALRHLRPPPKLPIEPSPSMLQSSGNLPSNSVILTDDTGVAVTLSEEEMLARARDFQTSSNTGPSKSSILGAPSSELQSPSISSTSGGPGTTTMNSKTKETGNETAKTKKNRKRKKWQKLLHAKRLLKKPPSNKKNQFTHNEKSSQQKKASSTAVSSLVQTSKAPGCSIDSGKGAPCESSAPVETVASQTLTPSASEPSNPTKTVSSNATETSLSKADKKECPEQNKKKRKHKSKWKPKRLQKRRDVSDSPQRGGFRLAVVRKNGMDKLIFGTQTLPAIQAKKKAAREKKKIAKTASASPKLSTPTFSNGPPASEKTKKPLLSGSLLSLTAMATSTPVQNSPLICSSRTHPPSDQWTPLGSGLLPTPSFSSLKTSPSTNQETPTAGSSRALYTSFSSTARGSSSNGIPAKNPTSESVDDIDKIFSHLS